MTDRGAIRFGVAGMTSDHVWEMGDGLAALTGVELVAGADPHPELTERAAGRWGLGATYADHRAMFAAERLDAVLVCCDNAAKADVVEAAAERRVHVYQDKPMAATLAQADRIARAAAASGITLMVAYHTAFRETYAETKELLRSGAIGTPYLARGVIGHSGPVEYGCSPFFQGWLFDAGRNGGGAFVDEACYRLDEFVDFLGPIAEVSGFVAQSGHRPYLPPGVEDNAVAILRFASGALGVLDAKWGEVGEAPVDASYHGSHGTLLSGPGGVELWSTADPTMPAGWTEEEVSPGSAGGASPTLRRWRRPPSPHRDLCSGGAEQRFFVDLLRGGRPAEGAVGPATARAAQEAIEAFYRSAREGRAVRLPLG